MLGIKDTNKKFSRSDILDEVGMCVVYPDGIEIPRELFYQADMQGLDYLRTLVFQDLINLIFLMANVRQKTTVKSNVSGTAKSYDNVDEQGMLANLAEQLEAYENDMFSLMATARNTTFDPEKPWVQYNKHYDLSSAAELFDNLTTGMQYKTINNSMYKYLATEYLRKRSAPKRFYEMCVQEVENNGMPMNANDIRALHGVIGNLELALKARYEWWSESARTKLQDAIEEIKQTDFSFGSNSQPKPQGNGFPPGNGGQPNSGVTPPGTDGIQQPTP